MADVITVNTRGTLTLPKALRRALRLSGKAQLVVEKTEGGIILRPSATFPVELYSPERLEEFERNNETAIAKFHFMPKKKNR